MKRKIQIISKAFDELRINGLTSKADSEDVVLALESLEEIASELSFNIGWRFEEDPDPNSYTGIPSYAERAMYTALAVRLAPRYNKDAGLYRLNADSAMSALLARVKRVRPANYSSRMPLGLGNRGLWFGTRQFMPPIYQAPDNVNTEFLVDGDVKVFEIDLTDLLEPNETVFSYEVKPTSGISITNNSLIGNVISITVTALRAGYEYADIIVTGDAGTKVNRRLNFSISMSESIRGNP